MEGKLAHPADNLTGGLARECINPKCVCMCVFTRSRKAKYSTEMGLLRLGNKTRAHVVYSAGWQRRRKTRRDECGNLQEAQRGTTHKVLE